MILVTCAVLAAGAALVLALGAVAFYASERP